MIEKWNNAALRNTKMMEVLGAFTGLSKTKERKLLCVYMAYGWKMYCTNEKGTISRYKFYERKRMRALGNLTVKEKLF